MLRISQVKRQQGIQEHKKNVWALVESFGKQCCALPALGRPAWQQCGVRAATQVCRDFAAGSHGDQPVFAHTQQPSYLQPNYVSLLFSVRRQGGWAVAASKLPDLKTAHQDRALQLLQVKGPAACALAWAPGWNTKPDTHTPAAQQPTLLKFSSLGSNLRRGLCNNAHCPNILVRPGRRGSRRGLCVRLQWRARSWSRPGVRGLMQPMHILRAVQTTVLHG